MGGHVVKVEGIDGSGKTWLVGALDALFRPKIGVSVTQEFGAREDEVSRIAFELAKNATWISDPLQRQLLFLVCSHRTNAQVIPKLRERSQLVLCDRSEFTGLAYSSEVGPDWTTFLRSVYRRHRAHPILWLDVDPRRAAIRKGASRAPDLFGFVKLDAIEERGLAFQVKVSAAYRELFLRREHVHRIDANASREDVLARAAAIIEEIIAARSSEQESARALESYPLLHL